MTNPRHENTRVLLTGANGFVGQFLSSYLQTCASFTSPPQIVSTYRCLPEDNHSPGNKFAVGDINGDTKWQEALVDVDIVVHLAARVHVMQETHADPLDAFREVNTRGTLNLAKQAAEAGVKRFIYLSTVKVNGEKTQDQPFFADDPPCPQDPYAISKFEAEQELFQLAEETDLEVVVIRPPLVYGFGVKGNLKRMVGIVRKSIPLPLKAIKNRRSLVNLHNLCSLISICLVHPAAVGQVFLVSDGEDLSTSELFKHIALALGKRENLFYFPRGMVKFLANCIGRQAEYERLFDSLQVDIEKNRQVLGWSPTTTVEAGIRNIVDVG